MSISIIIIIDNDCTEASFFQRRKTNTEFLDVFQTQGLNVRPRSYFQICVTNLGKASIRNQFLHHRKFPQERKAARRIQF